jgi:hypothetical protein
VAQFLIKAQNSTNPDPVKEARGCYKLGDVVQVMPDDHVWGALESLPRYFVVKVPGLDPGKARAFLIPEMDSVESEKILRRRKFRLKVEDVPLAIRNKLQTDGWVSITLTQLKNFLWNKTTSVAVAKEDHGI